MLGKLSGWMIGRTGSTPPPAGASRGVATMDARTADASRIPPGQVKTEKWPVLHYGNVPRVDLSTWRFRITGLVERPLELSYEQLTAMPRQETLCDIHCVTRWSRLDNRFEGVSVSALLHEAGVQPEARFALIRAEQGFTTNLPLADLDRPANLLAWRHNGTDLSPDHGWPLRLVVPHLYFWKSAKWVRGIELLPEDHAGFWEDNGYHMRGDPWAEERYRGPDVEQSEINSFRNASKK
jgi:DMSO/TMAO reductase YedYZ molybdopterin-dependent catalytic subunit